LRSIRPLLSDLIAATMAVALTCASAVGATAHAAGHHHHHEDRLAAAAVNAKSAVHGDAAAEVAEHCDTQHAGGQHGSGDSGVGHVDCCDLICHGWTAVLAAKFALPVPSNASARVPPGRTAAGVRPASLERPPRPLVLA
jgi:hypothetical protein